MAGYRSLLAFWSGGAGVEPPQPGVRSLLGFWIGGAGLPEPSDPPDPPAPPRIEAGGGGGWTAEDDARLQAENFVRMRNNAAIAMVVMIALSGDKE